MVSRGEAAPKQGYGSPVRTGRCSRVLQPCSRRSSANHSSYDDKTLLRSLLLLQFFLRTRRCEMSPSTRHYLPLSFHFTCI
ncbi:hypothetical protein E2C01_054252 [Portunus trituberculatus]|uniref:Uncharacterized protein n=1 Tax=Portunus trituberculatus TaxID=210409 RepID=A0A5B7GRH7_PORTR|nr:hypothetical protein [Portunus trituberculatus]